MTAFDAYVLGYSMAVRGFTQNVNPCHSQLGADWLAGWNAAVEDGKWGSYMP